MTLMQSLTLYTFKGNAEKLDKPITSNKLIKQQEFTFCNCYLLDTVCIQCEYSSYIKEKERNYLFNTKQFNWIYEVFKEIYRVCRISEILDYNFTTFDTKEKEEITNVYQVLLDMKKDIIPSLERGEYLSNETYFSSDPLELDIDSIFGEETVLICYSVE